MAFQKRLISVDSLRLYLYDKGAATLKEIKEHFGVDSKSTRRSLGRMMYREDINLIVMGGSPPGTTYWFEWPQSKRGKPSPKKLREEAAIRLAKSQAKRLKTTKKIEKRLSQPVEVDLSGEREGYA